MEEQKPISEATKKKLVKLSGVNRAFSDQTLDEVFALRSRLDKKGISYDHAIFNAFEFALLLQHDLSALTQNLVQNNSRLGTSLYARILVLTLYETAKKMQSLLAKDFRNQLKASLGMDNDQSLKQIHKRVSTVFEKCNQEFGDVRNGLSAHWDPDPDERQRLIDLAEVRPVADLVIEMMAILKDLLRVFLRYFNRIPKNV